jgi:hypothetical protein
VTERWKLVPAEDDWLELRFSEAGRGTRVYLRFGTRASGRRVIEELRIVDDEGVKAGLLRKIPLGQIEEVANTRHSRLRGQAVSLSITTPAGLKVPVEPVGERDDSFYRRLAESYAQAVKMERRHPARLLAEASGVSIRTMSRWLAEARRRGFMGPAT